MYLLKGPHKMNNVTTPKLMPRVKPPRTS